MSRPRSRHTPSSDILGIVAVPIDASELTAEANAGRRRRRYSTLTGSDRIWLWVMVAVPTVLHVMLVWVPALLTVALHLFFSCIGPGPGVCSAAEQQETNEYE